MPWHAAYRAYDDDTLTALANAGLLRRAAKDVEAGKVGWAERRDDGGVVAADGQRVALDARGPRHAHCDCPAPGICKHVLGAALWLRGLEADAAADPADPVAAATPAAPSALDEVMALDAAALFKAAGIAAVRRAAATPVERLLWRDEGAVLVLELPELDTSCRWVAGAGFAGMVSEAPAAERRALQLIALAALRRERGRPLAWPEGVQPAAPTGAGATDAVLGERERRFLAQVEAMLHELLAGGLAHVSDVTSQRLLALNMSARGEGLPRLAALLRNLGGMADLLARRDHRVEARDALALMARIHALCTALAGAQGAADAGLAATLRGRLRRDFDETRALDLLPLGAYWWQTRGGARGLTLAFWDTTGARLLQAALARPDASDSSFTRHGAWGTQSFWPGVGSAEQICKAALRLEQPRMADDGRLAPGGVTRAQTLPAWPRDDARIARLGIDDWEPLSARLREGAGLTGDALDLALLRPHETQAPRLDEARQRFDWPVRDAQGRWLVLTIPCGPEHHERLTNLDRLLARHVPVRAVLVRVERNGSDTVLMPVALLIDDPRAHALQTVALDFANEPARKTTLAGRILRALEARREQPPAIAAPTLGARLLAPVIDIIETQAETGRLTWGESAAQDLCEAARRLRSTGLDTLADALDAHAKAPTAGGLLRLVWLCRLLEDIEGLPLPGA
jgi:hypothetical protein